LWSHRYPIYIDILQTFHTSVHGARGKKKGLGSSVECNPKEKSRLWNTLPKQNEHPETQSTTNIIGSEII